MTVNLFKEKKKKIQEYFLTVLGRKFRTVDNEYNYSRYVFTNDKKQHIFEYSWQSKLEILVKTIFL